MTALTAREIEILANLYVANFYDAKVIASIGETMTAQSPIVNRMFWASVDYVKEQLAA